MPAYPDTYRGHAHRHDQHVGGSVQQYERRYNSSDNQARHKHRSRTPQRQPRIVHSPQNQNQTTRYHANVESHQRQRKIPPQRIYPQQHSIGIHQEQRQGTPQRARQQRSNSQFYQEQRHSTPHGAPYQHQSLSSGHKHNGHDETMYLAYNRPTTAELREEDYNAQMLREREAEMLEINKKMHTVQDIYKDLAGLIDGQEELIDKIDESLEYANANVNSGVDNYNQARLAYENPILEDPFGDKLNRKSKLKHSKKGEQKKNGKYRSKSNSKYDDTDEIRDLNCHEPFQTIKEDFKEVVQDVKSFVLACTVPDINENEYAYG